MYQHLTVVVCMRGERTRILADAMRSHFSKVILTDSEPEVRDSIPRHRPHAAVVDLEILNTAELRELCGTYPQVAVVTTHRSPDEDMWMEALQLGAVDCCHSGDIDAILRAITHNVVLTRAARAA